MNSFSISGPHLHGQHGRQSAKATGLPRQSLSSRLPPAVLRWGNKKRKKQREEGRRKKNRELYTQIRKMDTWRNLCTNACAQYVGPGNCLPEQSVASRRVGDRGGFGGGIVKDGGDSLPTRPSHSVSGLRPPSGIRRFSNAKTKLKPNRTKTEALRYDAMRNATKTNMFFN